MAKKRAITGKYRRPSLSSGARLRRTFDLPPDILKMLHDEADRREVSQVWLLKELIEANCDPKRSKADERELAF